MWGVADLRYRLKKQMQDEDADLDFSQPVPDEQDGPGDGDMDSAEDAQTDTSLEDAVQELDLDSSRASRRRE